MFCQGLDVAERIYFWSSSGGHGGSEGGFLQNELKTCRQGHWVYCRKLALHAPVTLVWDTFQALLHWKTHNTSKSAYLATGNLIQHFNSFFFSLLTKNHLHCFKVNMYHSIDCVTQPGSLSWHTPKQLCVKRNKYEPLLTSLTEAEGELVAMPAKATGWTWQQHCCFPSLG